MKTKMVTYIYLTIIICCTIILTSCINSYTDIPKLTVTYNGTNVDVAQGSYYWKPKGKDKIFTVDSYASIINKLTPAKVTANSLIQLKFDYQPQTITLSGGATEDEGKVIQNNIITVPDRSGMRIYFLDCEWEEGTVTYVVTVEVQ